MSGSNVLILSGPGPRAHELRARGEIEGHVAKSPALQTSTAGHNLRERLEHRRMRKWIVQLLMLGTIVWCACSQPAPRPATNSSETGAETGETRSQSPSRRDLVLLDKELTPTWVSQTEWGESQQDELSEASDRVMVGECIHSVGSWSAVVNLHDDGTECQYRLSNRTEFGEADAPAFPIQSERVRVGSQSYTAAFDELWTDAGCDEPGIVTPSTHAPFCGSRWALLFTATQTCQVAHSHPSFPEILKWVEIASTEWCDRAAQGVESR